MDEKQLQGLGWWFRLPYLNDIQTHPKNFENFFWGALNQGLSKIQSEEQFQETLKNILFSEDLKNQLELLKLAKQKQLESQLAQEEEARRKEALAQGLQSFAPEIAERLKDLPAAELSKITEKLGENFADRIFASNPADALPEFEKLPNAAQKILGDKNLYDQLKQNNPELASKIFLRGMELAADIEKLKGQTEIKQIEKDLDVSREKGKELSDAIQKTEEALRGITQDPSLVQVSTEVTKMLQDKDIRNYIDRRNTNVQRAFLKEEAFDKPEYRGLIQQKLQSGGGGLSEKFLQELQTGRANLEDLRRLRQRIDQVEDPEKRKILELEYSETLAAVAEVLYDRFGSATDDVFQLIRKYWITPLSEGEQADQAFAKLISKLEAQEVIAILKNFTGQKSNYELEYAEKAGTSRRQGLARVILLLKAIAEPESLTKVLRELKTKNEEEFNEKLKKLKEWK